MSTAADAATHADKVMHELTSGWWGRFAGEFTSHGFPLNKSSGAYVSTMRVKAGAGTLFGFSGFNSNTAAQWIQVFDLSDGNPSSGAAPSMIVYAPGTSNFFAYFDRYGRAFTRGILIANSTTGPTYTAGAADCFIDAQYV